MATIYTTEKLLQILADEYRACLNGQRLNLAAQVSGVNPLIDQFLNAEGIQKFTAYQDFRAAVHRYQREHQVSGILWRRITVKGKTLEFPEVSEQLIAIPGDLEVLKAAKPAVLKFWYQAVAGGRPEAIAAMDLYLGVEQGKSYQSITANDVEAISQRTEWASLTQYERANFLELVLQLGWGEPSQALYRRGWPDAGSEFIYAVTPGYQPVH